MVIGPGGERRYPTAAIINSDREGFPARICGRGGLGAVLASKGLKAIIIDDQGARADHWQTKSDSGPLRRYLNYCVKHPKHLKSTPNSVLRP